MPIRQADQSLVELGCPIPALAAVLFHHPHIGHHHPAVGRLAHVVDGQQPHLHGGQRLHFHPGLAHGFYLGPAMHAVIGGIDLEIHRHPRDGQRMAQRQNVSQKPRSGPTVGQNWDRIVALSTCSLTIHRGVAKLLQVGAIRLGQRRSS